MDFVLHARYSLVDARFVVCSRCSRVLSIYLLFDDGAPLKAVWGIFDLEYSFQIDKEYQYVLGLVGSLSTQCSTRRKTKMKFSQNK